MDVVVRPAAVGDADELGSVHVRAWQVGYRGLMEDEYLDGLSITDRQRTWREGLAGPLPDRDVVVVEDPADGHVCGFAAVGDPRGDDLGTPGDGELWAINLEPEAWGRGLAAPLLAGAVQALRARGCSKAFLWVLEENARARRFYGREGWTPDGGVKDGTFGGRALREVRYGRDLMDALGND
jgi:GNAT superfamily N-acetyltransferase